MLSGPPPGSEARSERAELEKRCRCSHPKATHNGVTGVCHSWRCPCPGYGLADDVPDCCCSHTEIAHIYGTERCQHPACGCKEYRPKEETHATNGDNGPLVL